MKQTIELEGNRKAVVEIPYSKLAQYSKNEQTAQDSSCCDSKVVLIGCGGCSSKSRQNNFELKSIISDLQDAYDRDVKQLQAKLQASEKQREKARQIYQEELIKMKQDYFHQLQEKSCALQLLKGQCKRKDSQIASLLNEKDILIRNKISEFRKNEYIDKISQLQSIIILKQGEIHDLTVRLKSCNEERIKAEEQIIKDEKKRLQAEEEREIDNRKWQKQVNYLKMELVEFENKYAKQNKDLQEAALKSEEVWMRKISEYQERIKQANSCNGNLEKEKQLLNSMIVSLKANEEQLLSKIARLETDLLSSLASIKQLENQKICLMDKFQKNEETVLFIDSQKGNLLLELQSRMEEIFQLKKELSSKQKVVEVKIERVVDGKPQIEELRKVIEELEMQLKQFSLQKQYLTEDIKKKENNIKQLKQMISKFEVQISQLKVYISRREGSFKWAVERQIQKDIAVSEIKSQCYKVSQVREYSRDISSSDKKACGDISAKIQQQFMASFPEQLILKGQSQKQ